ncbi:hypothetical protein ABEX78_24675 [Priestia megaterium]
MKASKTKQTKLFKHKLVVCVVCIILALIGLFCFGFHYYNHRQIEGAARTMIPEENTPQPMEGTW